MARVEIGGTWCRQLLIPEPWSPAMRRRRTSTSPCLMLWGCLASPPVCDRLPRSWALLLTVVWLFVACAGERAASQSSLSQPGDGAQQFATLGEFRLQSG